jgi:hypothetical protein
MNQPLLKRFLLNLNINCLIEVLFDPVKVDFEQIRSYLIRTKSWSAKTESRSMQTIDPSDLAKQLDEIGINPFSASAMPNATIFVTDK